MRIVCISEVGRFWSPSKQCKVVTGGDPWSRRFPKVRFLRRESFSQCREAPSKRKGFTVPLSDRGMKINMQASDPCHVEEVDTPSGAARPWEVRHGLGSEPQAGRQGHGPQLTATFASASYVCPLVKRIDTFTPRLKVGSGDSQSFFPGVYLSQECCVHVREPQVPASPGRCSHRGVLAACCPLE